MLNITFSNGVKATIEVTANVINLQFANSETVLTCFLASDYLEDFFFSHINKEDLDMFRCKVMEAIVTKEKNLHWLNNGSKMTALQFAELYLQIHGITTCNRIVKEAKEKGLDKGIYFYNHNEHNRINIVFLKKAIKNFNQKWNIS